MQLCSAYCAIRDRDVFIAVAGEPTEEGQANLRDLEIICMTYSAGPICAGDFCPNFGVGRVGMGVRPAPGPPV